MSVHGREFLLLSKYQGLLFYLGGFDMKLLKWLTVGLFTIGVCLVGYSLFNIGKSAYDVEQRKVEAKRLINDQEKNKEIKNSPEDFTFNKGETIGLLHVPKLGKELPIVEGTDEDELAVGVGHYSGTALPLQKDQIVLSGHRDTVFRNFDQLKIGDTFVVEMPYGKFEYEIYETDIVDADDRTVIRSTAPDEILTVTTCYPFDYVGDAPYRYIFYAKMSSTN